MLTCSNIVITMMNIYRIEHNGTGIYQARRYNDTIYDTLVNWFELKPELSLLGLYEDLPENFCYNTERFYCACENLDKLENWFSKEIINVLLSADAKILQYKVQYAITGKSNKQVFFEQKNVIEKIDITEKVKAEINESEYYDFIEQKYYDFENCLGDN